MNRDGRICCSSGLRRMKVSRVRGLTLPIGLGLGERGWKIVIGSLFWMIAVWQIHAEWGASVLSIERLIDWGRLRTCAFFGALYLISRLNLFLPNNPYHIYTSCIGVLIAATNLCESVDTVRVCLSARPGSDIRSIHTHTYIHTYIQAYRRRFKFWVDFPKPGAEDRGGIWRTLIPPQVGR